MTITRYYLTTMQIKVLQYPAAFLENTLTQKDKMKLNYYTYAHIKFREKNCTQCELLYDSVIVVELSRMLETQHH